MIYQIRNYVHSDYEQIKSWWVFYNEPHPQVGMMVEDGTLVLVDLEDQPVMTLTAYYTQGCIGYLEGFCASPSLDREVRRKLGKSLWNRAFRYLKSKGCSVVLCYCHKEKLVERYQELGMTKMGSLFQMSRILSEDNEGDLKCLG